MNTTKQIIRSKQLLHQAVLIRLKQTNYRSNYRQNPRWTKSTESILSLF